MSDDFCAVCAEPLEFTGYQKCGHKDTCSKCVARLRFVLNDKRCVICQQSDSAAVVTRYAGEYTQTLPAAEFDKLKGRTRAGDFKYLAAADAYFDDDQHFQQIRELCSFSHPAAAPGPDGKPQRFNSLKELRRHLETENSLHFCSICLEGRKVFVSEQVAYSKADLQVHQKSGDLTGPMAEAGFKGHPSCRFCRKPFYGDNELFAHMQSAHEVCFLCRRARPDKYIYYRDYAELEGHFRNEHYLCDQQQCLEARFVVFPSDADLKKHRLTEHNGQLSRTERRAALQIPVNLTYRRGEEPAGMEIGGGRPGITIGGAEGVTSRFRQSRRGHEDRAVADAMQASLQLREQQQHPESQQQQQQQQREPPASEAARPDDFPSISSGAGPSSSGAGTARWAAAAGSLGGTIRETDFPALGGQTKAARRQPAQAAVQSRSLVQRLAPRATGVRVIHAADPGAAPPAANPTGRPRLPHSSSEPSLRGAASARAPPPPAPAAVAAGSGSRPASPALGAPAAAQQPLWGEAQEVSAPTAANASFPALSAGQPRAAAAAARTTRGAAAGGGGWSTVGGAPQASSTMQRPAPRLADEFPSLSGAQRRQPPPTPVPSSSSHAAAASALANGGLSEGLRAANKAFVEQVRKQLSLDAFSAFRAASTSFMRGELSAPQLHQRITQLGAASVVPDMAALCPVADKRSQLLAAHRAWAAAQGATASAQGRDWVPPEAAAAAADHAERHGSWDCFVCTLVNSPAAAACEACTASRPGGSSTGRAGGASADAGVSEVQMAQEALLNDSEMRAVCSEAEAAHSGKKGKQRPRKVPTFEKFRVTGGDGLAAADWMDNNGVTKKKPLNPWGVATPKPAAAPARSEWAANSIAQRDRAAANAWSKQ